MITRLLKLWGQGMSTRQAFIKRHVKDLAGCSILEIGALDSPTFSPQQYRVKFLDFASKEQLLRENPGNPRYTEERLVEVDYVVNSTAYSKYITDQFDLVIANHAIEHIPDTIGWLKGIESLLSPGGHLFLAIPDRQFTFDYLRPETTIADVLRAHHAKQLKPDLINIFEHFYYYRPLRPKHIAEGKKEEILAAPRDSINSALAKAEKLHEELDFFNVHTHVYTYESFLVLLAELQALGLTSFNLVTSRDVDQCHPVGLSNEFHVLLQLA